MILQFLTPVKYNYLMTSSLEQIKQATKRKSNGFFFIKSKHVHPAFKNHTYFQMQPKIKTQQSESSLSYHQTQGTKNNKWRMFVDEPSSYGIENTYRYMCDRIKMGNKKSIVLKTLDKSQSKGIQSKIDGHQHKEDERAIPVSSHEPKMITTLKHKPSRQRLQTEPANKYLQTTQSFNYRIRKSKNFNDQQKVSETKKSRYLDLGPQNAEHMIQMIYIPGRSSFLGHTEQDNNRIYLNILPYIVSCFFKCKINYLKKLTQTEYDEIRRCIQQVKSSDKNYFDVKDIINLGTVQEVLQILQIYGEGTMEWTETVRYFFMPSQEVLGYQFDKMIDEIKVMSIMKFNAELTQQPLHIYRVEDRLKINNVYDMLKPGTYIYSENKACYEIYCGIIKKRAEIFSYKNRIKKWRSVAPLDQTLSNRKDSINHEQSDKRSIQKYQRLYELRKQRRKRHSTKKHSTPSNGIMITAQINTSFIDKSKLHHSDDIFQ